MKVIDDFYPALCRSAAATWPEQVWPHWYMYNDDHAVKFATKDPGRLTHPCRLLCDLLAAECECPPDAFVDFDLHGAGMQWLPSGGYLRRHQDSARHPLLGWYRAWNAVLFLSECAGGELVIDGCDTVAPAVGRLVMFAPTIPHQVLPVTSGDRKTLCLFWWSHQGTGDSTRATFL